MTQLIFPLICPSLVVLMLVYDIVDLGSLGVKFYAERTMTRDKVESSSTSLSALPTYTHHTVWEILDQKRAKSYQF